MHLAQRQHRQTRKTQQLCQVLRGPFLLVKAKSVNETLHKRCPFDNHGSPSNRNPRTAIRRETSSLLVKPETPIEFVEFCLDRDDLGQGVRLGRGVPRIHAVIGPARGPPAYEPNRGCTAGSHVHVGGAPATSVGKMSASLSPCSRRWGGTTTVPREAKRCETSGQDKSAHHGQDTETTMCDEGLRRKLEHLAKNTTHVPCIRAHVCCTVHRALCVRSAKSPIFWASGVCQLGTILLHCIHLFKKA